MAGVGAGADGDRNPHGRAEAAPTSATSAWTCTWRPASARPLTAVRWSSRRRPATSPRRRGLGPSRSATSATTAQARAHPADALPARRAGASRRLPPTLGARRLDAARSPSPTRRPARRPRRRAGAARPRRCSPRHDRGPRWSRQEPPRARGGLGSRRSSAPFTSSGSRPISDAALVPAAIANVVGVRESPGASLTGLLAEALEGTGALLVLDNLEHLTRRDCRHRSPARPSLRSRHPDHEPLPTAAHEASMSYRLSSLPTEDATTLFFELAAAQECTARRRIARDRRGDLPAARRLPARDRAGHGPARAARAGATPRRAGRRARTRDGGLRRSPATPANAARDARLELRAPDRRPAAAPRPARGLRGRQRARGRGAPSPGLPRGVLADLEASSPASLLRREAGDGACGCRCSRPCARTRSAPRLRTGTLDECRRRHAERFLAFAERAEEGLAGPEQARLAAAGRRTSSTTCARRSTGASRTGAPRRRCKAVSVARPLLARSRSRHRGAPPPRPRPRPSRRPAGRECAHGRSGQPPTRRWRSRTTARPCRHSRRRWRSSASSATSRHAVFALCEIARALSSRDELEQAYEAGEDALELAESSRGRPGVLRGARHPRDGRGLQRTTPAGPGVQRAEPRATPSRSATRS